MTKSWLIDKSALVKLPASADREVWRQRIERGLVRVSSVTLLEVGYSARSSADLVELLHSPPLSEMPVEHLTPAGERRALEVLKALAERGYHRTPSIPDLLIAAIAEQARIVVLHMDKDFDLIADITGQSVELLSGP